MANYSKINRIVPSRSRLIIAVGGNRKVGEWKCIGEVRERTGKLGREVVERLDEGDTHGNKTAQDRRLCLQSVETPKA